MVCVSLTRGPSHFLCCVCFTHVLYEEAYTDADYERWDMCPRCGAQDAYYQKAIERHGDDWRDHVVQTAGPCWTALGHNV